MYHNGNKTYLYTKMYSRRVFDIFDINKVNIRIVSDK